MPPKPQNNPDEIVSHLTAAFATQFQELQTNLSSLSSAITNQNASIHDLQQKLARLEKAHIQPVNPILPAPFSSSSSSLVDAQSSLPTPPSPVSLKPPKLHLTLFDGSKPLDWLFQADQYFTYYSIPMNQRLALAAFYMTGPALSWFQWMHRNNQLVDWHSFARALELRFGPSTFINHEASLFKLKLTSTVAKYRQEFEALSNRINGLSPSTYLNCFISGLPDDWQREMAILKPCSVSEAGGLAQLFEDRVLELRTYKPHFAVPPIPPPPLPRLPYTSPSRPPPPRQSSSSLTIKRLSPSEMQARRAKGLCFNCDEQYKPGHRCRTTLFLLLQAEDDLPILESLEVQEPIPLSSIPALPPPLDTSEVESSSFQVSLHALFGTSSYHTLKLTGTINGHSFTVLIDTGSTHNLIQPRLAKYLDLTVTPAPPFVVTVGNGQKLFCLGCAPSITLDLQSHEFLLDFYLLEIQGADIILGIQWLSQLGPILADFNALHMSFYHQGSLVTIFGDRSSCPQPISYGQLKRLYHTNSIATAHLFALEANPVGNSSSKPCPHHDISNLLQQFQSVFEAPRGLPPPRFHDHHIHLQPDTKPINVRPYRYPHSQKQDMTAMISEMLSEGIIKPSTSPFSSPVFIGLKEGWHLEFLC